MHRHNFGKKQEKIKIVMMNSDQCRCFFDVLITEKRITRERGYKLDELRTRYKLLSRRCHPDKVEGRSKAMATEAQKLINIAYKTLADKAKQNEYLIKRRPPPEYSHKCVEMKPVINWVQAKFWTEMRDKFANKEDHEDGNTETGADFDEPGTAFSEARNRDKENQNEENHTKQADDSNREQEKSQPDEDKSKEGKGYPNGTDSKEQERQSDSFYSEGGDAFGETSDCTVGVGSANHHDNKKRRGPRKFHPKDYQLLGGKIINNAQRSQGARYLMAWTAKPGLTSWLSESDVVEHYPQAAEDYLEKMEESSPRKWATIVKKAGPMVRLI